MRIRGTITEDSFRKELRITHDYLFHSKQGKYLFQTLLDLFPELKTAYILHWTPDDGADFFTIIINGQTIVFLEIEEEIKKKMFKTSVEKRVENLSSCTINEYKKGLSKINQIKLEVALNLCIKDMKG